MMSTDLVWVIVPWVLALLCDIKFRRSIWYLRAVVVSLACLCMTLGGIFAPSILCTGRCGMLVLGNLVKAIGFNSLVFSLGMFCLYKWRR